MISLDQCFQHYKGLSVLVDGNPADMGQCVQWADVVLAEVYGDVTHYGNAIDWWNDPRELLAEGFVKITDGSVKKGDFVVFNTKVGSQFGHIDVALGDGTTQDFYGADSNWDHNLTVHEVHHVGAQYVLGSLRFKGGGDTMDEWDVKEMFLSMLHREATAADVKAWVSLKPSQLAQSIRSGSEWLTLNHYDTYFTDREKTIAQLQAELASGKNNVDRTTLEEAYAKLGQVLGK